MMGQSFDSKQKGIVLERIARNHVDYDKDDLSDNTGYRPPTGEIIKGVPEQLATRLPIDELVKRVHRKGVNARISDDCGSNFCNETYYLMLALEEAYSRHGERPRNYKVAAGNLSHQHYVSYLLNRPQPDFKTIFVHLPQYPSQAKGQGGREFPDQYRDVRTLIDEIVKMESNESSIGRVVRYVKEATQILDR